MFAALYMVLAYMLTESERGAMQRIFDFLFAARG